MSVKMGISCMAQENFFPLIMTFHVFQNSSVEIIKKEWFKVSSHKLSDPNQVEDYLSSINEISKPCLVHIVNLQDDNVRSNQNVHISYDQKLCNGSLKTTG